MSQKIDLDPSRFRQIIRGKIKENLRKYISHGEMVARKGKNAVSIPLPQVDIPLPPADSPVPPVQKPRVNSSARAARFCQLFGRSFPARFFRKRRKRR